MLLLGVGVTLFVIVRDTEGDAVRDLLLLGVGVTLFVIVREIEGEAVTDLLLLGVCVMLLVIVRDTEGEAVRDFVTEGVTDGERVTLRVTEADRLTLRVPVAVRLGVLLFENRLGRRVGSLGGRLGRAIDGSSVGRGGGGGRSVRSVGSSVIIRTISVIIRSGIDGYSVTGIVGIAGRRDDSVGSSGMDGYSVLGISGTDGRSITGRVGRGGSSVAGRLGRSGILMVGRAVGRSGGGRVNCGGILGRSEGIAGMFGRSLRVKVGNPGIVGNAVEGMAGIESVGSKEGMIAIMDLTMGSMVGRAVNVRVGNGVGMAVPLGLADCGGIILMDGRVKPNCRLRARSSAFTPRPPLNASATVAVASIDRSISSVSY